MASPLNEDTVTVSLVGLLFSYVCTAVERGHLDSTHNEKAFICLIGLSAGCNCAGNTRGSLKMEKTCLAFIFIHL